MSSPIAASWCVPRASPRMMATPAAAHAIDVVRSLGGSLENHRSRRIDSRFARQADYIFAMTIDHLDELLRVVPEVEPRASCSTRPAATSPTRSAATTKPTAAPAR